MPYVDDEQRRLLNAWLARFAPLVMEPDPSDALDERKAQHRLEVVQTLRQETASLHQVSPDFASPEDQELVATFQKAAKQLDSIENDLRAQLARFKPGDPAGNVDLETLQARLAEREAKQEIGAPTEYAVPEVLEMQTQGPNMTKATGLGCMASGVTAFTLFHATFMIGGMFRAFGVGAFALLLFYSIFWFFCYKMFQMAKIAASNEKIELNGDRLKIIQTFMGKPSEVLHQVNLSVPSVVSQSQSFSGNQRGAAPMMAVMLTDAEGKPIEIAHNAPAPMQQQISDRINAYMKVQRNQAL